MKIKIFQIDNNRDINNVKFQPYELLERYQFSTEINPILYDEVFNGDVEANNLEDIYRIFNTEGHPLHRGHSLSVSDVVTTEDGAFYCDSVGFKKIEFDEGLTSKQDNLMQIVYVEPNKKPIITDIENTLRGMQKAVGGRIEETDISDEICLISNEESKYIGLAGNRRLDDGHSIIAGPFFVCGVAGEDFRGLTDEEAEKYMVRFQEPEEISEDEVKSDMECQFIGM